MADLVFNNALFELDRFNWDDGDAATIDVRSLLLDVAEAEEALRDHPDIAALLAAASTETVATSYTRYTHATQTRTLDNTNNRVDFDLDDAAFGVIGNGVNESIVRIVTLSFDTSDALSEPVSLHDLSFTTDGSAVTVQWNANGVWRAAA